MKQEQQEFFIEVLEILENDCTQTCNEAEGTKLIVNGNIIKIISGISNQTLRRLVESKYLVDCDNNGTIQILNIVLEATK